MSLNPDRTIYLVLCRYRGGMAWAERIVDRTDKASTIEDIRTGELPDVQQVIELHVAEFSSRDVTEDIMEAVKNEAAIRYEPHDIRAEREAWNRDHQRDLVKHGVHGW